jgi:hypothetical protein
VVRPPAGLLTKEFIAVSRSEGQMSVVMSAVMSVLVSTFGAITEKRGRL